MTPFSSAWIERAVRVIGDATFVPSERGYFQVLYETALDDGTVVNHVQELGRGRLRRWYRVDRSEIASVELTTDLCIKGSADDLLAAWSGDVSMFLQRSRFGLRCQETAELVDWVSPWRISTVPTPLVVILTGECGEYEPLSIMAFADADGSVRVETGRLYALHSEVEIRMPMRDLLFYLLGVRDMAELGTALLLDGTRDAIRAAQVVFDGAYRSPYSTQAKAVYTRVDTLLAHMIGSGETALMTHAFDAESPIVLGAPPLRLP